MQNNNTVKILTFQLKRTYKEALNWKNWNTLTNCGLRLVSLISFNYDVPLKEAVDFKNWMCLQITERDQCLTSYNNGVTLKEAKNYKNWKMFTNYRYRLMNMTSFQLWLTIKRRSLRFAQLLFQIFCRFWYHKKPDIFLIIHGNSHSWKIFRLEDIIKNMPVMVTIF